MSIKKFINYFLVFLCTLSYSLGWLGDTGNAETLISTTLNKPWVYRQLIPMLARLVSGFVRADIAIFLIVTISGIGLYLSLRSLSLLFNKNGTYHDIILVVFYAIGLNIFAEERMPYDLMTAWLFTLSLTLFAKHEYWKYAILFPLVCLNRETAFLLTVFHFVVVLYRNRINILDIQLFLYQVIVWVGIRVGLSTVFSQNGGLPMWVEPMENLEKFIQNPFTTILHLFITVVLLFLVLNGWNKKPKFLRIAFVVLFSLLSFMYLVLGQAFEIRVFWEVYPTVILLVSPAITEFITQVSEWSLPRKTLFERS